jgi:hypothetical protein
VAPLRPSDSTGATSFSATLSLVIAGILGTSVIYLVTRNRALAVRLTALVILAAGAGLLTALVTNVVVGAFSGAFLAIWGVATLFVLAMVMPIAAFQVLLGLPGTAVGLLVFVVVGDPSSGGSTAPQLLPNPWRAISQGLPPGAAATAMRDVVYFHGYGATRALLTLRRLRRRRRHRGDHREQASPTRRGHQPRMRTCGHASPRVELARCRCSGNGR